MKKLLNGFRILMAGILVWFSPITIQHGTGSCCAECVMKKEDEVELVDEVAEEETTEL